MNVLRYGLMIFLVFGSFLKQYTSAGAEGFTVGLALSNGDRYVTSPNGFNYTINAKYFDSDGNLTLAAVQRIKNHEASKKKVVQEPLSEPTRSKTVSAKGKRVSFVGEMKKKDGWYIKGSSANNERKFGENVLSNDKFSMDQKRKSIVEKELYAAAKDHLYTKDEELGHVFKINNDWSRIWEDHAHKQYHIKASFFDRIGYLNPDARDMFKQYQIDHDQHKQLPAAIEEKPETVS